MTWTPGIGDPTIVGWSIAAAYGVSAVLSVRARHAAKIEQKRHDAEFWTLVMLAAIGLGLNKQLDLQTLLTEMVRNLAKAQGWYGERRLAQFAFIIAMAAIAATGLVVLLHRYWTRQRGVQLAMIGFALQFGFIVLRAFAFNHGDERFKISPGSPSGNAFLEMTGIVLTCLGASAYARSARQIERSDPAQRIGRE